MAIVHKLRYDSTDLDLNDTSTGIGVEPGWVPVEAMPTGDGTIPPYVQERIPVLIDASSGDNLASQRQTLAYYQKLAAEYWVDPTQDTPVWYHIKLDDETGERRALVKSIEFQPAQSYIDIGMGSPAHVKGTLIIERHPYWERTAAVNMNDASPSAAASVSYDYTNVADIVGDVGARVERLRLGGSPDVDRFWVGIRSANKHGTVANFGLVWECEDGANDTDATDTVDATASGGNMVRVSESGVDWDDGDFHRCLHVTLAQGVGANYEEQFGNFLWLLRAKTGSSTTWEVELRFGYFPADGVPRERVEVDNSSWDFYEMGLCTIPLRNLHSHPYDTWPSSVDGNFRFEIYARRTSGSGDLDLDCVCPIPVDEGFLHISGASMASVGDVAEVCTSPEDETKVFSCQGTASWIASPAHGAMNFYLPPGDGLMIIACARASSSVLTDAVSVNASNYGRFYPRWLSLRGAE